MHDCFLPTQNALPQAVMLHKMNTTTTWTMPPKRLSQNKFLYFHSKLISPSRMYASDMLTIHDQALCCCLYRCFIRGILTLISRLTEFSLSLLHDQIGYAITFNMSAFLCSMQSHLCQFLVCVWVKWRALPMMSEKGGGCQNLKVSLCRSSRFRLFSYRITYLISIHVGSFMRYCKLILTIFVN